MHGRGPVNASTIQLAHEHIVSTCLKIISINETKIVLPLFRNIRRLFLGIPVYYVCIKWKHKPGRYYRCIRSLTEGLQLIMQVTWPEAHPEML